MKCPKCGGEMEEGTIADTCNNIGSVKHQRWGTGIQSSLSGLENPREVITNRCKSCGYLESYAK